MRISDWSSDVCSSDLEDDHHHGHGHGHHHDHDHDHDHGHEHFTTEDGRIDVNRHDSSIQSFCLTFDQPFEWNMLDTWLDMMAAYRGDNLLRVKGLLNGTGRSEEHTSELKSIIRN